MNAYFLIAIGGALGAVCRVMMQNLAHQFLPITFPHGTLYVNVIGCLLIGIFIGAAEHGQLTDAWKLFLTTGFCGGFTTFSAFSLETFALVKQGEVSAAGIYVAASVVLGLAAVWLGLFIVKVFAR
ncbi:MAG: fluoride efflux transporter CrcB [Rhizobacter sp.]|nr:fluoride efflux transporter CrcB [Chlorobiales bacterium]